MSDRAPCFSCGGEGECQECLGSGRYDGIGDICEICDGTGECPMCGGTGEEEE